MRRFLVAFAALTAVATAAYLPTTQSAQAAPKPTPTPTPVALVYDEIDRMVMAPATAPPPGSFQADYQVAMSGGGTSTTAVATPAATPTPQPRRHGLGSMIGGMLSGNIAGAATQQATENASENAESHMAAGMPGMPNMDVMNQLRAGRLTRFTFYYTRGWVREDDPVAQTATISKCNEHTFIYLDLKNKTYRQSTTQSAACTTAPMSGHGPAGAAQAPGTVDLTITNTSQNLGPRTLEGVSTVGYSEAMAMKMENATGSCRNANFNMQMVEYVSQIGKPRAYCPLSRAPVAGVPGAQGASGGCQPKMHTAGNGAGVMGRADKLEMYVKTTYGGSEGQQASAMSNFANVLERGNVKWLYKNQADPLFEIPAGFTQQAS